MIVENLPEDQTHPGNALKEYMYDDLGVSLSIGTGAPDTLGSKVLGRVGSNSNSLLLISLEETPVAKLSPPEDVPTDLGSGRQPLGR